jgi:membrane-bound ClpP family serine protease
VIILGVILLIAGFLLGFYLLWVAGAILLVVGLILLLLGRAGHSVGPRNHYW